ncbi:MAG: hypothetical protein FWF56_06465 [Firmicutes bacterium]|nr:hypothetical protein [Bacillota bacterium]MCL1953974.1 hypothetical protein [Bacillota bacterium]
MMFIALLLFFFIAYLVKSGRWKLSSKNDKNYFKKTIAFLIVTFLILVAVPFVELKFFDDWVVCGIVNVCAILALIGFWWYFLYRCNNIS